MSEKVENSGPELSKKTPEDEEGFIKEEDGAEDLKVKVEELEEKLKQFECKICMETAHEPVVTPCGHLYW